MNQPTDHHPQGPSQLENLDPKSGGCRAFKPLDRPVSELAEKGSRQHLAIACDDLSILEGDREAETEVIMARDFIIAITELVKGTKILREERLEIPHLNFGTADYVVFSPSETVAYLVDIKFGAWSVTSAKKNLQILNYAAAIFLTYPKVQRVKGYIFHIKTATRTSKWFYRAYLPKYVTRIREVVENAQRAAKDPQRSDFTPNPVNCGFCGRVNCPARLELASSLVSAWTGKPVAFSSLSLTHLPLEQLAILKQLGNALKSYLTAVDEEARRRAFDEGQVVPGYEIRQKSGIRKIISVENITAAAKMVSDAWVAAYPDSALNLEDLIFGEVEIGVINFEKAAGKSAPKGQIMRAQKLISEVLENSKLVNSLPVYYLSAVKS